VATERAIAPARTDNALTLATALAKTRVCDSTGLMAMLRSPPMRLSLFALALLLGACASAPPRPPIAAASGASAAAAPVSEARTPPAPALPDDRAADVVLTAMAFLDTPYRLGGNSVEQGFDCSGFTRHVYAKTLGLALPRRSEDQAGARALRPVERAALASGDLVFFNTLKRGFSHVGIYLGDGKFIHAPRSGSAVRVENMRNSYWAPRFDGARRVALAAAPETATHSPSAQ
jgi:cell wall-associated NlpC family hydrolase